MLLALSLSVFILNRLPSLFIAWNRIWLGCFFRKKNHQAFYLHPDIICLTNSTAVPGLINRNLLNDRVLDIVWSFDKSNVPIDTDYHSLALRISIIHLCSWLRKVDHHDMVFSSHDRNIWHTLCDGNLISYPSTVTGGVICIRSMHNRKYTALHNPLDFS